MRPVAREAFLAASAVIGNPSAQHTSGRWARGVLDDALDSLAADLRAPAHSLLLTSGGTEADNLALRGVAGAAGSAGPDEVAVGATDHAAVLETARAVATAQGHPLQELPVGADGLIDTQQARSILARGGIGLISVGAVNNETGVVQDVEMLASLAHDHGALVHTDAVQSLGHVPLPALATGPGQDAVDLMTLSGHKIGAPVGVGLLLVRPEVPLAPVLTGGGQQRGVRSGTLDAPLAAAFAAAVHEAVTESAAESARLGELRDRLLYGVRQVDPTVVVTAQHAPHAPHIAHLLFPGADQDALLFLLDQQGVDASAGSACTAGVTQDSHVLRAMGVDPGLARGAVRFSFGRGNTPADVDRVLALLPEALVRARAIGGMTKRR
jgi:cysteine desulfurase